MSEVADSTEARSQSLNPLFTEHSNTDKMKKRRTVADSVANVGESGNRDRCLGTSVFFIYLFIFSCVEKKYIYLQYRTVQSNT